MRTRNFIDREVFESVIHQVPRIDGAPYEDTDVVYGDMSRLVVAWLANTPAEELHRLYGEFGWGGRAGVRAMQAAAQSWMREHRPQGLGV
jgi:hypothetical protein